MHVKYLLGSVCWQVALSAYYVLRYIPPHPKHIEEFVKKCHLTPKKHINLLFRVIYNLLLIVNLLKE